MTIPVTLPELHAAVRPKDSAEALAELRTLLGDEREYRSHLHFMDLAHDRYGYVDHAYRRFVDRINDAVDRAGILSPGKQGMWPARLRVERS